jgi:hypothetical protein
VKKTSIGIEISKKQVQHDFSFSNSRHTLRPVSPPIHRHPPQQNPTILGHSSPSQPRPKEKTNKQSGKNKVTIFPGPLSLG